MIETLEIAKAGRDLPNQIKNLEHGNRQTLEMLASHKGTA